MKKFYLAIISVLFFAATGFAQVQLIPASDGGFENGTTFAANNWNFVSSGQLNNWADGALPAAVFAGSRAAYVSTNGGANNAYNNTAATSHFWRDIVVPGGATSITLSFELKSTGQAGFDQLLVYTAPNTVTPVAAVPASPLTAIAGATLVYTQPAPIAAYALQTIILPNALAGTTVRLIFTWQNNGTNSFQPPAAVDDISLTYIPPIPPTITSFTPTSACLGNTITITGTDFTGATAVQFNGVNAASYIVVNNTTITAVLPASGVTTGPITVTTPNGTGTSATDLTINPPAPTALTYTSNSSVYCVGTAITNNTPSNGGGAPTAYSVSPALPAGLSIDPVTGIISGTPTAVTASAAYTVTASNSCGNTTVALTIEVSTAPVTVTYSTNPATYCANIAITANSPTTTSGGAPAGYTVSPALPAGLALDAGTGVISGTPTTTAGVATATYTVTSTNICGSTTTDVVITISPAAPTALTYTLTTASYCVGTAIANNNPSNGGGTPASYSVSPALPAGLSIDPVTGIISGTPTAITASATYTVTATNSCGNTTKALTIDVSSAPITVTYTTNPATYCAGVAIASNLPTTTSGGAPTGYTVSPALPAGLALDAGTGVISGTPTTTAGVASANYTVTSTNICGSTTTDVVITISPAAPTALTYTLTAASYCVGTAIANNNPSNGGGTPASYSVSPALPAGLSIDPVTGIISGTPTAVTASATYTVTATNSCGNTTKALTIDVPSAPLTVTYATNPATYCAGVAIAANSPTTTSGGAPTGYTVSPALPAGLTLNAATGVISGTPTTTAGVAAATYTVTSTNGCGSTTTDVVITISPAAPTALTYTNNSPTYCVGTAIAGNNPSNGGGAPASYSVSPALPAGLSIDPVTGIISGTPTAATASANYTVTATNSCGNTTKVLTIVVNAAPLITYSTNPATYCAGQLITNNTPTNTGGPAVSYSVSPALPAGLALNAGTGVISGTPTTTAGVATATYTVTATNGCGSTTVGVVITISPAAPTALTYTNNSPTYCVGTAIANNNPSNGGGAPASYSVSPALPAGLSIDPVAGIISGTPTAVTASANYTVTATNSCGNTTKVLTIAVNAAPLITYSTNPATYCAGQLITNNTPANTGGPAVSYSVSPALPAGLTLNAATGIISGTPTTTAGVATATYTVTATNGCGSTTVGVVITISPAAPTALTYTNNSPTYCVGTAIAGNNPSNGGGAPASYSVSPALPAGLSIDPVTGIISGTPTAATASANYTVTATNSCGNTTKVLTIVVNAAPLITYSTNPATYCAGQLITNNTPTNTGGPAVSYSVSPALPAGLALNAGTGVISGTPTTTAGVATATYTVTSTNGCGSTTVGVVITISPAAPTALNYTLTPATYCVGTAIANNNPSNGGGTPASYSVSPALPAGLSINSGTGVISGTPIVGTAAANYTVTASNSCGTTTKVLNITVNAAPSISGQPADQSTCAGTAATFSVTASGTSPTYQWQYSPDNVAWSNVVNLTPPNINYTNATTATLTVTPAAAAVNGTYYYRCVVSVNSCASVNSNSATLTVYATPTASNAGNSDFIICTNTTNVTLAANTPVAGHGTAVWSIDPSSPSTLPSQFSSLTNPTAVFTPAINSGVYKLWWTISNGTCNPSADWVLITINPPPVVSGISADQVTCAGAGGKTFTVTASGISLTYQWQYSPDNVTWNNVNNGTPANITYSNPLGATLTVIPSAAAGNGTYFYRCIVTGSGCAAVPSGSATLTVNINSTISLSSAAGTNVQTLCQNTAITNITYAIGGGGTGATVTGLPAGVTGSYSGGTFTITGIPTASGTFNYTVTTTGPCTNPSLSGTITANPVPVGLFTATENSGIAPNDNIICQGANVTFSFSVSTYGSYIFKVNGVTKQTGTSNNYSNNTLINGDQVTVDVADAFNCGASFGPITITVNPLPTPTLSADKTSICPGDNVTFTATGGTNYNFKVNGSPVQSGASTTYSSTTLTNGASVTVDVTNANGCLATSAPVVITVNALPSGTLSASPTTICAGASVTATATAGFSNYNFKVNGVSVQNSASNTFTSSTLTNGNVITVDVINASGCTASFGPPQVITVKALPVGTLTATENSGTPNDNIICAGSTVTFTATAGFTNYKFSINGGAPVQNSASNVYTNSTLASGDVVSVLVTNAGGCTQTFNTVTITVNPLPAGTLTASANPICSGDNIDFTADAGFANYNFKVNGVSFQNGSSNTANRSGFTNGDIVTVDVSNVASCTATFNSLTITVNVLPTGSLSVSETSGNSPDDGIICTGATVTFTANSGYSNYNFKINNITVQFGAANTYVTNTLANGDVVSVEVTNASGCVATFNTITITVNTIPPVSPITGPGVVCVNSTITLSDVTTGGVWSSGDNSIATVDASGNVTGVDAGVVTIAYKVTNANGCDSTVTKDITVNAVPVVSPVTGTFSVCVGSTTQLSDATALGTWSSSDNGIATVDINGLVTGVSSGTVTISYSVTNGNGCTTVVTATVNVNDLPVVASITGTLSVCVNSTTTLSDVTSGGTWSSSNTAIATVNASGVVTGKSGGTATISYSVTNLSGCNTTVTADVTVNPLPVPTLTGPNPICPNSTDVYTTEAGQSNYQWNFTGGTLISGGTTTDNTITILWDQPGARTISVNYQNSFGCSGATSATVLTSTGTVPTLSGPTAVCLNSDGSYSTQTGQTAYTWIATGGSITSGGTGTDNTATINWNVAGPGSVSINFTDVNGCTPATPTVLPVTVHTLPTASISGNSSVCQGGPTQQVTFTGASGAAPYTFTYTINGGSNQTVTTIAGNSITVNQTTGTAGPYIYALVSVSDNNGCSQLQAGSVTITVNPLATGTISGTTAVCKGSSPSPVITFTGTIGTAPFTFKYNINGGATQTVTTTVGNSVTVAAPTGVAGTFTYNLVSVSDVNGCLNPQSGSAIITVNALPTATISGTTSVCLNAASPNITFTGAAGTPPYTFTYNINGGSNLTVTSVGNTATVPAPTTVAGTFIYNLVSVQDASSTLCSQGQAGSATVTVNPTSVGGTVASNATVCSGTNTGTLTLSGQTGNVIRWESSIDGGATWVPIANTTTSLTYNNITQTTQYRAVVQSGVCSSANSAAATITVNAVSVGGTVASNATVCSGTNSGTLTLSGQTGSVVRWESSTDNFITINTIANTTTSQNYTNLIVTTKYRAVVSNGVCAPVNSAAATITVNALPVVTAPTAVCVGSTATLSPTSGGTWVSSNNGIATVTNAGVITGVSAGSVTFTFTQTSTGCSNTTSSVTVNALPAAPTITPSSATICQGNILPLFSGTGGSTSNPTFSSGTINLTIPDNSAVGAADAITVSGIPAGAIINSVSVQFNIAHTNDGDLRINLKAPNNGVLNLVDREGGSGNNFTNTIISSSGVTSVVGQPAPFNGTFSAEAAAVGTVGASAGGGNTVTTTSFAALFGTPNGSWQFSARDMANGTTGSITNWSITINYTVPAVPQAVTWSPITDLYTDAAATTAYAGQSLATVYVKPSTSGGKVYTATATNAAGCIKSTNVNLTVNPTPVVSVFADYCAVAGKVRLTATATPAGATFIWSTGQTGSTIDVDIADDYTVVASYGTGCSATGVISVAQELVTNGDFEAGNVGFTSDYAYKPDLPGLVPAGQGELYDDTGINGYSITPDGQNVHINFWGQDHTSRTGNFMAVNGHGNTLVVWKETVNVLPNTTYYFSAWAMSLNNVGPFAQLRFSVNGTLVGTTAVLNSGVNNNNNGYSPPNAVWTRFYGTWLSGPTTTTADIFINDLQPSAPGNDFGLDDVSFGTLSTFIDLESPPGTDAQTICVNTPITDIVYSVGSTASGPTITGLPAGLTSSFNGILFTISGTPTTGPGTYTYKVTTTGTCLPSTATGTITIQGQTLTLTSGSSSPTVCINTALTPIVYTVGGTGTGATVKGLPAGVTGTYNGVSKTFTISGTPTVAGVFQDTVISTGTCKPDTAYGTITVQNQTILLSSGPATQTVCINDAITSVVYTVSGTATGAGVVGLPAGVTGFYSGGSFIISGTPTVAGTFNYTVTTTGTCNPGAVATGTITVNPAASIALSSAAGTDAQTVCINNAITDITYTTGGTATGASITSGALPAGVTGSFGGGVFTISGTPTAAGVFNYTITATGTCAQATISGTITVQSQTIVLTSGNASPTLCMGSTLTNIVYTIGGTATGALLTGSLPTGITGVYDVPTKTFTISGSPSQLGTFNYTVTTTGGCSPGAALSGTITVNNGSVGGTVTPSIPAICSGGGGILNLLGQTGNVVQWESSTDGFTTITVIANNTTTINYLAVTVPTQYRALVKSGSCTGVYSSVAAVAIHNYWVGGNIVNPTDWNTPANWSDNLVPSTICPDVYIPNTVNKPVLTNGPVSTITNLHILAGAQVTINGTGLMQIGGTISNAGIFDVSSGAIEFNGTSVQTIAANTFLNNAVHDLIISNSTGTGVTLGGALNVFRSLTYNKNGAILNTGGFLTLKSTIAETAWLGDMTNHTINGDVTVERYIATGTTGAPNHGKSWQLLAVPTQGQTIKASWQEGATATNIGSTPGSAGNPVAGYGTMITSDVAGAATQPSPGFDALTTPGPSVKVYDYLTTLYVGPPNTNLTQVYNQKGYFVFVRGDRGVFTSAGAANPTILRTKGTLFTPANPPPATTVFAGKFESVGNPYASAIDMRSITLGGGAQQFFIVWDPRLGGAYNYGAFQTLGKIGPDYYATPGGGSYGFGPVNVIQSGQAFFAQASGINGSVSFTEAAKANGSSLFTTPNPVNQVQHTLRTSLNTVNTDGSTGSIVDGVLSSFDDAYSNAVDGMDARKMINTGENLAIKSGGKLLVIERKQTITQQDTIFLNITGERAQPYRFHFDAENLDPSVQGYLVDSYTNTRTPLNMTGSTDVNFTVANVTGSNAANRFMIVFEPLKALPVTFTSVKAYKQDKNINVEWRVDNEMNMKQYEVEKSTNGTQFSSIAVKAATANNGGSALYVIADANPVEGFNYYRIKSVDVNGKLSYTNVVKVLVGSMKQDITIYPNPITDGMIHLQLMNMPGGKYNIRLLNKLGQLIVQKQITHAGGNATELIKWDFNLAHGMYQLEVTKPDGTVKDLNVMY